MADERFKSESPRSDGNECEGCAHYMFPGIRWPADPADPADLDRSWVERCDTCELFATDALAAAFLARLLRHRGRLRAVATVTLSADNLAEQLPCCPPGWDSMEPDEATPPCGFCGAIMRPTGACFTCPSCGETTGCG